MKKNGATAPHSSADSACPSAESARSALDWARESGEADRVIADLESVLHQRRRRRVGIAAGGLMLIAVAAILQPLRREDVARSAPQETVAAQTVVTRPETRTLPDGTVVELNVGAEINIDFSGAWRRVALRKGVAHFQVAKNPQRPFVVAVENVEVRAVGTAFSVELGPKEIEVLVTEGQVAVERPDLVATAPRGAGAVADAALTTFGAGNRIVVEFTPSGAAAPARQVTTVSTAEIGELLAWRVPRLEFAGTPLAQALPMFNQHGRVKLSLADPALGRLQLSGVLRADDTESLLRLLEGEFGVTAESRDGELVLRRRP
jgi:transmembrane sensor